MLDHVEVARILDILGNRNRRRIIDLLRQKPCFVTEISDRLMLSPKAVIEHLQMMEREEILSFKLDDRRRKYYYLANDITVMVNLNRMEGMAPAATNKNIRLRRSLFILKNLVNARDEINDNLRSIEKNIDAQIREIVQYCRDLARSDSEINILIALAHCDLTLAELSELTDLSEPEIREGLRNLTANQLAATDGKIIRLCGVNVAE